MKKRKLGKNGPELTEIGLGTWAMGGPWAYGWGPADDRESINAIHRALDLGINWIDTAPSYGLGHAEEIVGKALAGRREKVIVATKCGIVWNSKGRVRNDLNPGSIRRELQASLSRLKTDYIDLYQIHWPDPNVPVEKSWRELVSLKKQGKIRWLGVSNFNVPSLEKCETIRHIDSLQPPYSLLRREIEIDVLPYCQKQDIGVVAYSPLACGLLSGSFSIGRVSGDDWRRRESAFQEPQLSANLKFADSLRPIADEYQVTVGQLAIAWVLQHPAVTSAIVGARRPAQVEPMPGGSGWQISEQHIKKIESLSAQRITNLKE